MGVVIIVRRNFDGTLYGIQKISATAFFLKSISFVDELGGWTYLTGLKYYLG